MENPGFPGVKAEVNCLIKIVGYKKYSDEYDCIPKIYSKKGLRNYHQVSANGYPIGTTAWEVQKCILV